MSCNDTACECSCTQALLTFPESGGWDPGKDSETLGVDPSGGPGCGENPDPWNGLTTNDCRCYIWYDDGPDLSIWITMDGWGFVELVYDGTTYQGTVEGASCTEDGRIQAATTCYNADMDQYISVSFGEECSEAYRIERLDTGEFFTWIRAQDLPASAEEGYFVVLGWEGNNTFPSCGALNWGGRFLIAQLGQLQKNVRADLVTGPETSGPDYQKRLCVYSEAYETEEELTSYEVLHLDGAPDPSCQFSYSLHAGGAPVIGDGGQDSDGIWVEFRGASGYWSAGGCEVFTGAPFRINWYGYEFDMEVEYTCDLDYTGGGMRFNVGVNGAAIHTRRAKRSNKIYNQVVNWDGDTVYNQEADNGFNDFWQGDHTLRIIRNSTALYWYVDGDLIYASSADAAGTARGGNLLQLELNSDRYNFGWSYLRGTIRLRRVITRLGSGPCWYR